MSERNRKQETADVMIIGGGIAGLCQAIKIKETEPSLDVLVVEKATAGTSGKSNKGAGIIMFVPHKIDDPDGWDLIDLDVDDYCDWITRNLGQYLNHRPLMEKYVEATRQYMQDLQRWGVKFQMAADPDDEQMEYGVQSFCTIVEGYWRLAVMDHSSTQNLRKFATKLGVRFVDKTQMVDLTHAADGSINGVVGFNLLDGSFFVGQAKAVVLATGSCNYMNQHMWLSARGDGQAAAYRAGAQIRDAEFSNFFNMVTKGSSFNAVGPACMETIYNQAMEPWYYKYIVENKDLDFSSAYFYGMLREVKAGHGPMLFKRDQLLGFDLTEELPVTKKFFEATEQGREKWYDLDGDNPTPECHPTFLGEFSAVRVDEDMKTTLEGLWAIGDVSYTGSAICGALPGPPARMRGSGNGFAAGSAEMAAPSIVAYAASAAFKPQMEEELRRLEENVYDPLNRTDGDNPRNAIWDLRCCMQRFDYAIAKTDESVREARGKVLDILYRAKHHVGADGDYHMLGLCHDIRNMATCAYLYYTAALERKESRGFHIRVEYPVRNDHDYVSWSVQQLSNGKNKIWFEPVPLEDWGVFIF